MPGHLGEGTPQVTGFFEVTVAGKLVHSKKRGDGYVDTESKLETGDRHQSCPGSVPVSSGRVLGPPDSRLMTGRTEMCQRPVVFLRPPSQARCLPSIYLPRFSFSSSDCKKISSHVANCSQLNKN
ncbi:hypothetical protein NN561_008777 [Cricetulus griseus]